MLAKLQNHAHFFLGRVTSNLLCNIKKAAIFDPKRRITDVLLDETTQLHIAHHGSDVENEASLANYYLFWHIFDFFCLMQRGESLASQLVESLDF